jgi:hypothetical protein
MHCFKIDLVYGTIKIIMDLSSNFSNTDIVLASDLCEVSIADIVLSVY